MEFLKRPLAITDIETTGLDASLHEIIELAVLIIDQKTWTIQDIYETRVKPTNLKVASQRALRVAGYSPQGWRYASNLHTTMDIYAEKTKDCLFVGQNVFFEWSFVSEAFKKVGVEDPMDYHRIDLFTVAWAHAKSFPGLTKFTLENLAKYFKMKPEQTPHRAMNGARLQYAILKELLGKKE